MKQTIQNYNQTTIKNNRKLWQALCYVALGILWFFCQPMQVVCAQGKQEAILTHKHVGNATAGGACYAWKSKAVTCTYSYTKIGFDDELVRCHVGCTTTQSRTDYTRTHSKCGGAAENVTERGNTVCGHSGGNSVPSNHTYTKNQWEVDCGMSNGDQMGRLILTPDTTETAKQVVITATYEAIHPSFAVVDPPYIWNGQVASAESNTMVTSNGTTQCRLHTAEAIDSQVGEVSLQISNIDSTGPTISDVLIDHTEWVKEVSLTIFAEDKRDDGNAGIGLHEAPYSMDGGATWQAEATQTVKQNGSFKICVRDVFLNQTEQEFVVDNIDQVAPTILKVSKSTEAPIEGVIQVKVVAEDYKEQGEYGKIEENPELGVGLHESPYSFNGGRSWKKEPTHKAMDNGKIRIAVRDKLENIATYEVVISNIIHPEQPKEEEKPTGGGDEPKPEIPKPEIPKPEIPKPEPLVPPVPDIPIVEIPKPEIPVRPVPKVEREEEAKKKGLHSRKPWGFLEEEKKEPIRTYKLMEERISQSEEIPVKKEVRNTYPKIVMVALLTASGLAALTAFFLLLHILLFGVLLYETRRTGRDKLLGLVFLQRDKYFYIKIEDSLLEKADGIYLCLRMSPITAKWREGELLFLHKKEELEKTMVQKEIHFTI